MLSKGHHRPVIASNLRRLNAGSPSKKRGRRPDRPTGRGLAISYPSTPPPPLLREEKQGQKKQEARQRGLTLHHRVLSRRVSVAI